MIIINKDWALTNDQYSVTLLKRGPKNDKVVGHYPNFTVALQAMIDKDIQDLDSLKFMIDKLDALRAHINEICCLSPSSRDSSEE